MSGRILIVDDTATNRVILKAKLASAYYTVLVAESGEAALTMAAAEEPDLILLDVMMPGMDGFEVCRRLKASPALGHIPVVMVTALNAAEERIRGLEAGADDFLTKPLSDVALFARVRNLSRMKMMLDELRFRDATTRELGIDEPAGLAEEGEPRSHVLIVAGDEGEALAWAAAVAGTLPVRCTACFSGPAALDLAARDVPDVIVLAQDAAAGDVRKLVAALRDRPATRLTAIVVAVPGNDLALAASALDLGASDYILVPFDPAELQVRLRSQLRRKRIADRLRNNVRNGLMLAMVDPLTGLYNRRYVTRHLGGLVARADSRDRRLAVMMLDLDRFKAVNDRFGHDAGDEVLKEFARRLQANVRSADLVARHGGEEFLVAMPEVSGETAGHLAERVRRAVEGEPFPLGSGRPPIPVTVSIGVCLGGAETSAEALLKLADEALYSSKQAGRNRVTLREAA